MKKLFLIVLILSSFALCQVRRYDEVYFYKDSVSTTLNVGKGYSLNGLFIPTARIDSLRFKVSPDNSTFYFVGLNDSTYVIFVDSTARALNYNNSILTGWQYIQLVMNHAPTDTFRVKALLRSE